MPRAKTSDPKVQASREIGMAMGHRLVRYLFDAQDLHYGYWPDDLPVHLRNVKHAQEAYTAALIEDIPEGVKTILDVGCGSGATALRLLDRGYEVDCVGPPGPLTDLAKENLGARVSIFETQFQTLEPPRFYDLVLFSESILFIRPLEEAIGKAVSVAREDGYILVCDIFRRPREAAAKYHGGPIGGGHYLDDWNKTLPTFPLKLLRETDITDRIAPTFAVLEQTMNEIEPIYGLLKERLRVRRPFLNWLVAKVLNVEKYETKYFTGRYSAENFRTFKAYYRLLYQRTPAGGGGAIPPLGG